LKRFNEIINKKDWFKLTYLLIDHGRAICNAKKPNATSVFSTKSARPPFSFQNLNLNPFKT